MTRDASSMPISPSWSGTWRSADSVPCGPAGPAAPRSCSQGQPRPGPPPRCWPGGAAELDAAGAVVGVHGLTLRATRHRFLHRGQARHTWCAFDSVGIPAALAIDAVARTDCPSCQEPLTVVITEGVPERGRAVLWLPDPPTDDLMAQFCSCADLYCSTEHLRRRIDPAAIPGEITDLDAAAELGRQAWADVVGLRLGPGS